MTFFSIAFSQVKGDRLGTMLAQLDISWKTHKTNNFVFFVEENYYAEKHIEQIKNEFDSTRKLSINFLGDSIFFDTASIIIVDTKEKIGHLLGFEVQGFAIPESSIVVFLHSPTYSLKIRHELAHYYAFKIWGRPYDNWFSEGLAVYFDNKWSGYQVDSLSKHLKDNNRLLKLTSFARSFYSLDPMIAYPQIGSFFGFLLSKYGLANLKEIWRRGMRAIKEVYNKTLKELELEWLIYLDDFQNDVIDYSRHLK